MSLEYPILVSQAASSSLNTRPRSSSPSLTSRGPEVWVTLEQCGCQRRLPGPGPGEVSLETTTCSREAHSRGGGQQVGRGDAGGRGRQE